MIDSWLIKSFSRQWLLGFWIFFIFFRNNSDISIVPVDKNQNFYPNFSTVEGIKNVQVFANQVGLIRTKNDFEGIVFKGVSTDYNWSFFQEYLIEGKLPSFNQPRVRDVLLSKTLVNRLHFKLNDTINVFFLKSTRNKLPSRYKLVIVGIYDTGFNPGIPYNGYIDDLRIYDRALSAAEVQALYNMGQ